LKNDFHYRQFFGTKQITPLATVGDRDETLAVAHGH